jgi:C4-dicarboxylate-specific signal transduction histidine kinase
LTNSSKLAALGEMAGGVAHEINNPLQILSLSNEQMRMLLMNDDLNLSRSECEKLCDQMESTIDRVTDIVKGMKLISRDGHQDAYESLNLKEVVEDTLSLCREKFHNHGVKLYFYEDQGINDLVMAQKVRLSQVILNLLNNAFDAIQPNSSKIIRVYLGKTKSDHVSLSVSDNGAGVPEELIDKVFQPFFTTKDIGKGTGLGLSISKGIIEQHNGNFFIDKEDHSKFVIELPEIKENQNA